MAGALIFSFLLSGCNEEEKEKTESPKTEGQQTEIQEDTEESEETIMKSTDRRPGFLPQNLKRIREQKHLPNCLRKDR